MEKITNQPPIIQPINIPDDDSKKEFTSKFSKKFSIKDTFAALRYPNYKLWFYGQLISLFGSWMQVTALGFFVFELTRSPAYLGYLGFAGGIPAWIFTLYAGAIADRFDRKTILIITQFGMMFLSIVLAVLTFTNIITPYLIIVISVFLGLLNAFDAPARHAFVNELVEKEDLVNAIALNSTMFHSATALGPALGGIIYAFFGPGWCFTINSISFFAVIYSLYKMKLVKNNFEGNSDSIRSDLKNGFKYLLNEKAILVFIFITTTTSLLGTGVLTLFPAWAVNILGGDATTNGFLQSARGFGAVIFALIIATINKKVMRGNLLGNALILFPIVLIIFSFNRSLIVSLSLLVLIGGFMISIYNLANGLILTMVDEKFRGRIMGIYSFSFLAFMPIGSLIIGWLAELFGSPTAILINSVVLLFVFVLLRLYYANLKVIR
ncbi:MAG: MFS transporter [Bacteroidota bacterium]